MKLKDLRERWEPGLTLISEFQPDDFPSFFAVLKDRRGKYHLHFYMKNLLTNIWDISVECQAVTCDEVFAYLKVRCPLKLKEE